MLYTIVIIIVDGAWSGWANFGSCSLTCGSGQQEMRRTCTNPAPSNGGATCPGASSQFSACKLAECPGKFLSYHTSVVVQLMTIMLHTFYTGMNLIWDVARYSAKYPESKKQL